MNVKFKTAESFMHGHYIYLLTFTIECKDVNVTNA